MDEAGGFMVSAHPFRGLYGPRPTSRPLLYKDAPSLPAEVEEAADHPVFGLVDAVEVANGGTSLEEEPVRAEGIPASGTQGYGR